MLQLQSAAGNAAMTALLAPRVQRQAVAVASAEAPGLTQTVADEVNDLIAKKQRQKALDVLVTHLGADGQVDLSHLEGGRMYYSTAIAGEGLAPEPGYRIDSAGNRVARPTPVKIGRKAFTRGLSWLYSSVLHEYQHVLQFQRPGAKGTTGQATIPWLIERQEVEAYATECLLASRTGLDQKPKLLKETWRRLHVEHWLKLGPKGKKELNDLYSKAYAAVRAVLGPAAKIPFKPVKP